MANDERMTKPDVRHLDFWNSFVIRHSAFVIFILLCGGLVACKKSAPSSLDPNAPVEVVTPGRGAYTGAFIDFGDAEDALSLDVIEEFETMVGKHQAIIASSSYWGEQDFPTENLNVIWRHGSLPLIFWSPWDRPYEQNKGPDRFGLDAIIAGTWDSYIDQMGRCSAGPSVSP